MEKAALSLAASVVSSICSKLGDTAAPYFGGDITEEEVKHLQNIILPKFQTLLMVAEAVPVAKLKPWLETLQDAAYEAEDVLDMYEYKRLEAQVSSSSFKKFKNKAKDFVASLSLKTELKKSMEKLRQSSDQADKLITLYGTISQIPLLRDNIQQQQQQPTTTSSPPLSSVFGRDKERDLLVDKLISTTVVERSSSQRHTPVLAICGLGGTGKTILAQCVYKDSRVVEHFDTRMWVHVTRKFDVNRITAEINQHFKEQGEGSNSSTNLNVLQMRLKENLKSKKFLLVLDDVWCQDGMQWDQMLSPLNEIGDSESRILVTTRTQEVALKLETENAVLALKDLEYEHCMSIFKHYSFGDANKDIDPELATVAEQIMDKLKKSPLSAKMVGSALKGKTNVAAWQSILKKDEMLKGTLDALCLSFDILPPHLQRCFAFCSLYPKGYHFEEVDDLVKLWIAQGFVESTKKDKITMEDIGMQYFNELVSNSFFQKETTYYGRDYFVIHDLLHDLAEKVSKGHCFRMEDDSKDIPPTTVRHLSIWKEDLLSHKSHICKLENLRTFMITNRIDEKDYFDRIVDGRKEMFEKFQKLRVLHLGYDSSSKFLESIDHMKHLRSLQVYEVERLPESLGRLYHLQFLNLKRCSLTEEVIKNWNKLINLRFLLGDVDDIIPKIPFFGQLVSLQSINEKYNVSRKKGHGIGQLKNLRHLRGLLRIAKLENVKDKAEASEASLKEKILLEKLTLTWTDAPEDRGGRVDEEVIQGLEPPPNLNVLRIEGYNGIGFPGWLCFLRLSGLSIENCGKLERVPSLPSTLKELEVVGCENLNEMPSLPSGLRVVRVYHCPKLMQLSPYPPNLEELDMWGCPGVETLLWNILLFEGEDEQPSNQQKQQQQHFRLKKLSIARCSVSGKKRLLSDPNKLFTSLAVLELVHLPWLTSLFHPDQKLTSLEKLSVSECPELTSAMWNLQPLSSLRHLGVTGCPKLITIGVGERLPPPPSSLRTIAIDHLSLLTALLLPQREFPISLRSLTIQSCTALFTEEQVEESFRGLSSLTNLWITDCPNLTSLPANMMEKLSSLTELWIRRCPKMELLPNLPSSLEQLWLSGCHPQLEAKYGEDGPLRRKLQHIPRVNIS